MAAKTNFSSILGVVVFLISCGALANFGGMEGGGGKVVVCNKNQNGRASVELLDIWEARVLYNGVVNQDLASAGVNAGVKTIVSKLKNSFPYSWSLSDQTGLVCESQDCVPYILMRISQRFLLPHPEVIRLRGVRLALTNDSYEIAVPKSCEIQQVVNYQPNGRIYIDQDLYEQLDTLNQIALIAHEAFYTMLRQSVAEQSSVRTRRAIGYAMSTNEFSFAAPNIPRKYIMCSGGGFQNDDTTLFFYPSYDLDKRQTGVTMFIRQFGATPLIGIGSSEFQLSNVMNFVINRKCTGTKQIVSHVTDWFKGPVEFDKYLYLNWMCEKGVPTPYVNENRAGSQEATTKLSCSVVTK